MTKDFESVGNYVLTSEQQKTADDLMEKYGYKNKTIFMGAILRYIEPTLKRLQEEAKNGRINH